MKDCGFGIADCGFKSKESESRIENEESKSKYLFSTDY
jgi:hypothetical protein